MRRLRQPLWYSLLAMFVSMAILAGCGIWYTNHVQRTAEARQEQLRRESDQRWCDLLVTMDDAYSSTTPVTELGKRIAALMHKLRTDFDC